MTCWQATATATEPETLGEYLADRVEEIEVETNRRAWAEVLHGRE